MIRVVGRSVVLSLCVSAGLVAAAGVWETKPFTDWTDKETQAVLTDSPWAGKGSLTHARAGGNGGAVPDWKITVSWRTGLPIRQALVRQQIGQGGKVAPEQQAMLTAADEHYIIAVEGVPGMYAGAFQAIGMQTTLERDGKPPIAPTQGVVQLFDKKGKPIEQLPQRDRPGAVAPSLSPGAPAPAQGPGGGGRGGGGGAPGGGGFGGFGAGAGGDGSTATMIFGFPKIDPITAADKEVEFSTTIGAYHLKRKFRVKDMVVNGEPSL